MKYLREILFLLGDYRRKLPVMLAFFLMMSILDLAGIGLIGPYMAIVVKRDLLDESYISLCLVQLGIPNTYPAIITALGLILVGVFLLKGVAAIAISRSILKLVNFHNVWLRTRLMQTYQQLPYSRFLLRNSAEYILAIQSYTSDFTGTLQFFLKLFSEGIVAFVILFFLFWKYGSMMGLIVVVLGTIVLGYDRIFRVWVRKAAVRKNLYNQKAIQGIQEGVDGLKDIRVLAKELYFLDVVRNNAQKTVELSLITQIIAGAPRYLLEVLFVTSVVLLVIGSVLSGQGVDSMIPMLAVFAVAALRLLPSANLLTSGFTKLRYQRHSVGQLYKDLHKYMDKEFLENDSVSKLQPKLGPFKHLKLSAVRFKYPNTEHWALDRVSLSIESGESIGLIGQSGSGKTTLVDVILGLLEPQEGELLYNGRPLRQTEEWRSHVAYLPQDVFLIDNTLRRNVALGVPDEEIDDQRIYEALSQAQLSQFAEQLPKGVETSLGERGVRLSGGQRQRVALARAFYHGRNVLVLDEATSSLDHETEREIVDEIRRLKRSKTMIVIAHRFTTVQHCDRIYRLDKGQIVEQGSYRKIVGQPLKA